MIHRVVFFLLFLGIFFQSRVNAFPNAVPLQSCVQNMADAIPIYAHLKATSYTYSTYNVSCFPQPLNVTGGFSYQLSSNTWTAGVPLTLTINDTTTLTGIRGFYYSAFDSFGNRLGSWTWAGNNFTGGAPYPSNLLGQIINCPNGPAVSHTTLIANSKKFYRPRTLTLSVTIPTPGVGPIYIRGITLTDRTVWYIVNITAVPEYEPPTVPTPQPYNPPAPPAVTPIPLSTVALHNNSSDCWQVYFGDVYAVGFWALYHPGAAATIYAYCGQDASAIFNSVPTSPYSGHIASRLSTYLQYLAPLAVTPTTLPPSTSAPTTATPTTAAPTGPSTAAPTTGPSTATPTTASTATNGFGPSQMSVPLATVQAANTAANCLIIINGNVYSATAYLASNGHPGGSGVISVLCGKDASTAYNTQAGHIPSNLPVYLALQGPLTGTTLPTVSLTTFAAHNTQADCWINLFGEVYDATAFISGKSQAGLHPGGAAVIVPYCGQQDGSLALEVAANHQMTEIAMNVVWQGPLAPLPVPIQASIAPAILNTFNTNNSCWISIYGNVYNPTNYLNAHPGGPASIIALCGKEATSAYLTGSDQHIVAKLPVYTPLVGPLIPTSGYVAPTGYTFQEVSQHKFNVSCWIVFFQQVYDATWFVNPTNANSHPGGVSAFLPYCGTDGTQAFLGQSQHQANMIGANVVWLGPLLASPSTVTPSTSSPTTTVSPTGATTASPTGTTASPTTSPSSGPAVTTTVPATTGDVGVNVLLYISLSQTISQYTFAQLSSVILTALSTGLSVGQTRFTIISIVTPSGNTLQAAGAYTVNVAINPSTANSPLTASQLASSLVLSATNPTSNLGTALTTNGLTATATPSVVSNNSGSTTNNNTGLLIGVIVASVAAGLLLLILIVVCVRKNNSDGSSNSHYIGRDTQMSTGIGV